MPHDTNPGQLPKTDAHDWLEPRRIPASEYSAKFLSDLQARNEVLSVAEGWTMGKTRLPPRIRWVLYPNGDLQHL